MTVVGAGLTGIETASELAEQGRAVTLVCGGRLAPSLSDGGRRSIAKWFRKHGVTVLEDDVVAEVRRDAVVFADGAVRPSAVTIWTAGFGVPQLAADSGLRTDDVGRLLTDETLTSVDNARIIAAGDCASPSGVPLRMSCQSASQLGPQAANTVLSRIAGTAPNVLEYMFVGSCVSLGRRAAALQVSHKDDSPRNLFFTGRVVASIKEAVCKGTVWSVRREARKPGSTFLAKGGPRPEQPASSLPRWSRRGDHSTTATRRLRQPASTPSGSPTCGRSCSRSSTKSSVRQPNPTTCYRTAICGGRRWTSRRCATPSRISRSW